MAQQDLRTYRRRKTTRESGYHTIDGATGGECKIKTSDRFFCRQNEVTFTFHRSHLKLQELFEDGLSIIAFGGCVKAKYSATVSLDLDYVYEGQGYAYGENYVFSVDAGNWCSVGIHAEQSLNYADEILEATVKMVISSNHNDNVLDFISFDFDIVNKEDFLDKTCAESFHQRTKMCVPYLYYLNSELPFYAYLTDDYYFEIGETVVLKSCNRCGRFLPINIKNETNTLGYSLHCKKKAPCTHSTFHLYTIINQDEVEREMIDLSGVKITDNKVDSYYGHQLECRACKKFFVNAPLNPQRNPQQFKEDGLRRRALEVLVNNLLDRNLVHFEYESRTHKEFSKHIWEKFDKRCFKCGPESPQIPLSDMALDHTMPLAYLYRLDESATCLCTTHNSRKRDHFPVEFYSHEELVRLSAITGLSMEKLSKREINTEVLNLLIENVDWYYDVFLMNEDYQKIRDGIKTADKINDSLKRVINGKVDLAEEYKNRTGHYPTSISTNSNPSGYVQKPPLKVKIIIHKPRPKKI